MVDGQKPREGSTLLPVVVWAVPTTMMVLAIAPMPYGYYQLLRLVSFSSALGMAYLLFRNGYTKFVPWALALVALLYNPIFPVHFTRETWAVLNIATAAFFGMVGFVDRRRR